MSGHPDGFALVCEIFERGIRPPERIRFSEWLPKNLVLIDGPQAGALWNPAGAPYLPGIADCLSDDHPCNLVTVRKSQQTGASVLALAWCLYVAQHEPANMLYAVPGLDALRDINGQKLQPLIEAWQRKIGRTIIAPQTSRSGEGSTTYEKKFPNGYLALANANSVMDLSMKTVKKGVKDEVSKWDDIPGHGDPEVLFFGRFTAFRRTRDWKILEISTPEIDTGDETKEEQGHCRVDRSFHRSDQRYWFVTCPECGVAFRHEFDRLIIDLHHPQKTVYQCECGHHVTESERVIAVREGQWQATQEGPDRHPGFHIDAFVSMMMSYEAVAEDWINAQRSETGKKDFNNLVLGLPYKFRGDAPDHKRLMERREDGLTRGHVPPRGIMLVAFADVQQRGIWLEVLAIAPNRESWVVDALYLDGDTADPHGQVYKQLKRETIDREFNDAFGRTRRIDALGVDSGYRAHVVYSFVRNNQRVHPDTGRDLILATKGLNGWSRPAIGAPSLVDIDLGGSKIKQGAKVWGLGTWPLKGAFYSDLHKEGMRSGAPEDPDGYCHFGHWQDEIYFRQITAEHLENIKIHGRIAGRRWVKTGDNHWLDCRVGNMALAEYLGLSSTTDTQWAALARLRGMPEDAVKQDLFTRRIEAPAETAPKPTPVPPPPDTSRSDNWIRQTSNWFGR